MNSIINFNTSNHYITIIMFKLKEIVTVVGQKADRAFKNLTKRLTDRVGSQILKNSKIQQFGGNYLHDSLPSINTNTNKLKPIGINQRNSQNKSEKSLKNSRVDKLVRNSASIASHHIQRQLQKKRQRLMGEIRQIDNEIKNQHVENIIQKIKRNKTQAEFDMQSHEKATKLVQKMNQQRKQMMQKKTKEALTLKQTVQQSLKKLKQMQQMKRDQQLRKKLQIEKRIQTRKYKALQRDKMNKMSNQIIKELNSYKISLPDIYHKQHQTIQQSVNNDVMLTNIRSDLETFQVSAQKNLLIRQSRVSSFLDHVRQEQQQKKRLSEKKKQYQKNVRDKQLQFGKKIRYQQKIKSDRKQSKSKIKQINKKLRVVQNSHQKYKQYEDRQQENSLAQQFYD